ncbi:hypothetical protein NDU88_001358 [Pleurodeles waltl]|uniref:Uncharacterized protein n=1 Tax=Pleurodeles waltl TaxID=8319 RepID=A0AAV7LCD6_PLEWA|nr:hypothetical protein NDU88_001358 [Pleurodeles waltl]
MSKYACSREVDSPTTSNTESGAECRSTDACEHEIKDIGNPAIRIPEHIPKRSREEDTIAEARNPAIRVPDRLKKRRRTMHAPRAGNRRRRESGAECRFADACEHEIKDIGNPAIRIPEHIPKRSREEETIAEAGNPEIRVPDRLKREDGLRERRTLETGDAKEGEERGDERREVDGRRTPVEVRTSTGLEDTATGQDGPKERERRHVPWGTWLSQRPGRDGRDSGEAGEDRGTQRALRTLTGPCEASLGLVGPRREQREARGAVAAAPVDFTGRGRCLPPRLPATGRAGEARLEEAGAV